MLVTWVRHGGRAGGGPRLAPIVMVACLLSLGLSLTRAGTAIAQVVPRVMPLGDSTTAGLSLQTNDAAYRTSLETRLLSDGRGFDFVGSGSKGPPELFDRDHEGLGGRYVSDVDAGVPGWFAASQPDVVLLMIGTNDVRNGPIENLPTLNSRFGALLDKMIALRPTTHMIVASIPPQPDMAVPKFPAERVNAYNSFVGAVPGIVDQRVQAGKKVVFADVFAALGPADIVDGSHPTAAGHAKVAGVFHSALVASARVPVSQAGVDYLGELQPTSATNGSGSYRRNRTNAAPDAPIRIRGVQYGRGLGTAAVADIRYNLGGGYTRFLATVGIDDLASPNGSVSFRLLVNGGKIWDSGTVTGTSSPVQIDISVVGFTHLQLVVAPTPDGNANDFADWGHARLVKGSGPSPTTTTTTTTVPATTTTTIPPSAATVYLGSELAPTSATNGLGPYEVDRSNGGAAAGDGPPIRIRGVQHTKGLGTASVADLKFDLGGAYSRFQATVGIDDAAAPNGSVSFRLLVNGAKIWDSGIVTGTSAPVNVDISVAGVGVLQLVTAPTPDGTANDLADWAMARVIGSGSPATTTTTTSSPTTTTTTTTVPATTTTTIPPSAATVYLGSELAPTSATNGLGPYEVDRSNGGAAAGDGPPIRIRGVQHTKGLGTASVADLRFDLGGAYSRFQATVGIDDAAAPNGSVSFRLLVNGAKIWDSGIVTGTSAPVNVDISVAGVGVLQLVTAPTPDGTANDLADWAMARVIGSGAPATTTTTSSPTTTTTTTTVPATTTTTIPPSAATVYLGSELAPTSATNGLGPYEVDRSNGGAAAGDGPPIRIRGVQHTKGLGTASVADLKFDLGGAYSRFQATVGIDDAAAPNGSVSFRLLVNGAKIWDSGIVTGTSAPVNVDISVAGVGVLQLVTAPTPDGTANDLADWAMARVIRA